MKLEYVHIAGYKNLVDTELTFIDGKMPVTIIGNNGTGKSNLIEALLHIFISVYYGHSPEFNFRIRYTAHNKKVEIFNSIAQENYNVTVDDEPWSHSRFKAHIRKPNLRPPFPSQVFTYYSGTCDRIERIINKYNRSYLSKLRNQSDDLERLFVFSGINQAEWILLSLVAHRHHSLLNELGVGELNQVKLTLQSPDTFVQDRDDPAYWGTVGGFREFLADLDNASRDRYEPYVRGGFLSARETRVYVLDTDGLMRVGAVLEKRGTNLYSMLQALSARNILVANEFDVVHRERRSQYRTESLSEGEKQLLCVLGGLTLARNEESLVLLDEPDTHLNPAWSWRYCSLLGHAISSRAEITSNATAIIATHNPIMISGLTKEQVFIARYQGDNLIYEPPYRDPRGQGVANVLVSEYFGLPSSLDENTQALLDERLLLAYKQERLSDEESARLSEINEQLKILGLSISFRDPAYKEFEEQKFGGQVRPV